MSGFGHLFGALVFGRYRYSLLRILSYVYLIVLGVGAPIPLLIMHWNLAHVLLNFWLTPVWLLSFLVWLARRFFMESFSILALNRPLRWVGSDTWEALSNSCALNIWHKCRKTWGSCCCLNHCGLCWFHFNFRLFLYLILFIFIRALQRIAGASRGIAQWTMNHYIPLCIYVLKYGPLRGYMLPTTFYGNQKQPLIHGGFPRFGMKTVN